MIIQDAGTRYLSGFQTFEIETIGLATPLAIDLQTYAV